MRVSLVTTHHPFEFSNKRSNSIEYSTRNYCYEKICHNLVVVVAIAFELIFNSFVFRIHRARHVWNVICCHSTAQYQRKIWHVVLKITAGKTKAKKHEAKKVFLLFRLFIIPKRRINLMMRQHLRFFFLPI